MVSDSVLVVPITKGKKLNASNNATGTIRNRKQEAMLLINK